MTHPESEEDLQLSQLLEKALAELRLGRAIDPSPWQTQYPRLAPDLPSLLETLRELDCAAQAWRLFGPATTTSLPPHSDPSAETRPGGTGSDGPAQREGADEEQFVPSLIPSEKSLPGRIGRYRILRRLGRGGMGTVYQAEDPSLQRVVALKVPRLDRLEDDPEAARQRFRREAQAAAKIRHPHVCPIHDVGEYDGVPFVVMAYVEGKSLADRLAGGQRLPDDQAVRLISQVAEGLAAVHEQGIIHRDLKPANILLDAAGQAILTDFGLARPVENVERLTAEGTLLGTPGYMAPEQASGEVHKVGIGTDIYSLGVILYQMVVGRLPFVGPLALTLHQIAFEEPCPPSHYREDLNRDLERIIVKAMARRPEDRYADARALARALNEWHTAGHVTLREGETKPLRPTSPPTVVRSELPDGSSVQVMVSHPQAAPGKLRIQVSEQPQTKRKRRRVTVRITLAFTLLLAAGLGGLAWYGLSRPASDPRRLSEQAMQEKLAAPDPVEAHKAQEKVLLKARALLGEENVDGAIELLQQLLRIKNDFPEAHFSLGVALEKKEDLQGARRAYQTALEFKKDFAQASDNLGGLLSRMGDMAGAIRVYREAINRNPDSPETCNNLGMALASTGDVESAIAVYQEALRLKKDFTQAHYNLGNALEKKKDLDAAIKEYQEALRLKPDFPEAYYHLGVARANKGDAAGAIVAYRKALAVNPKLALAHNNLGVLLAEQGDLKGGIACYQKALELDPKFALIHFNLGNVLLDQRDLAGAIACYLKALDLDPKLAPAYHKLGNALVRKGDMEGAIVAYRGALRLKKDDPEAHYSLGLALKGKGDVAGAIKEYQEALRLKKDQPEAWNSLGTALMAKGVLKDAIAAFQEASRLKKDFPEAHYNLGLAAQRQGDVDGAVKEFQEALRLKRQIPEAAYQLGTALMAKGDLDGAIAALQEAIRLKKDFAEAHCNLGIALQKKAQFDKALAALKRGHELGSKRPGWVYPSSQWVKRCERLLALEDRLTAVLQHEAKLAEDETLDFAALCSYKRLAAASARFYKQAFTAHPKLAEDLTGGNRYDAACMAALAGRGKSTDAAVLDAKERARWRSQARDWLRADLELWARKLDKASPTTNARARQTLQHWQRDPDLAGVREEKLLRALPEAEQQGWRQFWAEVSTLVTKVQGKP
jgi:tetratricopeptide (TPR) repeat protein/serine/threonine protein kinase